MPGHFPWRVIITVPTLLAVALVFGLIFGSTGSEAALAIASVAVGALAGYLGKLNGAPD